MHAYIQLSTWASVNQFALFALGWSIAKVNSVQVPDWSALANTLFLLSDLLLLQRMLPAWHHLASSWLHAPCRVLWCLFGRRDEAGGRHLIVRHDVRCTSASRLAWQLGMLTITTAAAFLISSCCYQLPCCHLHDATTIVLVSWSSSHWVVTA